MKKEYINPTMLVVNMKMDKSLLVGSDPTIPTGGGTKDPTLADSPEFDFDFWDE